MKKILGLFFLLCVIFTLTGCGISLKDSSSESETTTESTTTTTTKDDEAVLESLTYENANTTVFQNETYTIGSIKVYANYSDDSKVDVTSSAVFSTLDTSTLGQKKVIITYMNKTVEYNVTVVEKTLVRLDFNNSNAKVVYKIGEKVSTVGLVVTAVYSNNSKTEIINYSCVLKDSSGNEIDINNILEEKGSFTVEIRLLTASTSYKIYVYDNTSDVQENLKISNIINNYQLSNGVYNFNASTSNLLSANHTSIAAIGEGVSLTNLDENGNVFNFTYDDVSYSSRLVLNQNTGKLQLTIDSLATVVFAVGGRTGRGLNISNGTDVFIPLGNISQSVSLMSVELEEGTYDITSTYSDIYIYDIICYYNDLEEVPTLESITYEDGNFSVLQNEVYNHGNIKIYANYSDNTKIDVTTSAIFSAIDTSTVGVKTQTVTYEGKSLSYDVTVESSTNLITINFSYSGQGANNYNSFTREIDLNTFNPEDYIIIPTGYAFCGFGLYKWSELQNNETVKIYIEPVRSNQFIVAYLNSEYLTYDIVYVSKNQNATPLSTHPEVTGKEFVSWDVSKLTPVTADCYILPIYADIVESNPVVTINSSTSITVDTKIESSDILSTEFSANITGGNSAIALTSLTQTLDDLDASTNYLLSGKIKSTYTNGLIKVYKLNDIYFTTNVAESLNNINEPSLSIQTYTNGITVEPTSFIENTPEGYSLYSIALYNENELVEEVLYTNQTIVAFMNLEGNYDYRVDAFYELSTTTRTSLRRYSKLEITPGYRIHFVGFQVRLQGNGKELKKVDLTYNEEILYTYYTEEGSSLFNPFSIMLPIKYENLTVVGSYDYEEIITDDTSWELELIDIGETNKASYKVIFYEKSQINSRIIDIVEVLSGASATPPADPEPYYGYLNDYKYVFDKWNGDYENVTKNELVYASYTAVPTGVISITIAPEVFVGFDNVRVSYVTIESTRSPSVTKTYYITGGLYTVKTEINNLEAKVEANTDYIITIDYEYKDENKLVVSKTASVNIRTLTNPLSSSDVSLNKAPTYCWAQFKLTKYVNAMLFVNKTDTSKMDIFVRTFKTDFFTYNSFVQGTTYEYYYYMRGTSDTIYNMYYGGIFTTVDCEEPVFKNVYISKEPGACYIDVEIPECMTIEIDVQVGCPEIQEPIVQNYNLVSASNKNAFGYIFFYHYHLAYDPSLNDMVQYETSFFQLNIHYTYNGLTKSYNFFWDDFTTKTIDSTDFYYYEFQ